MSPLAVPPARGFADFQRTGPWDSPVLWNVNQANVVGNIDSGAMDVSRWGYIAGLISCYLANCQARLRWYLDSSMATVIGERFVVLDADIFYGANLRIPNLGPFAQVLASPAGGAPYSLAAVLIGTNRDHPLELIPHQQVIVNQDAVAIGAASTATVYPTDYYAGPVQIAVHAAAAMTLILDYLDATGTWRQFYVLTLPAGGWQNVTALVPEGAWRAQVVNGGGGGTYDLKIVPSLTGGT